MQSIYRWNRHVYRTDEPDRLLPAQEFLLGIARTKRAFCNLRHGFLTFSTIRLMIHRAAPAAPAPAKLRGYKRRFNFPAGLTFSLEIAADWTFNQFRDRTLRAFGAGIRLPKRHFWVAQQRVLSARWLL